MIYTSYQVIVFGAFTLLGGIIGYVTAGSWASLVAGAVFGVLLFIGGIGLYRDTSWGFWMSLIATLLLLLKFAPDFAKSGKVMPAGVMAFLALWVLGALFVAHLRKLADSH